MDMNILWFIWVAEAVSYIFDGFEVENRLVVYNGYATIDLG